MNVQTDKKGFTIIEVVLVLAIAALIFLMIFVALPALQRGQRDTARKSEAGQIASAVTTYVTNNNGKLPSAGFDLTANYADNLNQITNVEIIDYTADPNPDEDEALVVRQAECSNGGSNYLTRTTSTKKAAVVVYVESGGRFCQDV